MKGERASQREPADRVRPEPVGAVVVAVEVVAVGDQQEPADGERPVAAAVVDDAEQPERGEEDDEAADVDERARARPDRPHRYAGSMRSTFTRAA